MIQETDDIFPVFEPGWVWIAGAGPGDPGLLTLHADHALAHADVVVHDALVSPAVLARARPGARLEFAGKRGGKPSPVQRDISDRIIQLARSGERLLRLKGGDPYVFGRGGEEALALAAAGVPFRVIPGISAGIGGLAAAGIPLTHRDVNHAVTFVTGHMVGDGGGMAQKLDWEAISRGSPVIVFYMALGHLEAIAARLMQAGRPPSQPVAVISNATLPEQQVVETTLARVKADSDAAGMKPPAMMVVGDVVPLLR